jgi:hypothetical protein
LNSTPTRRRDLWRSGIGCSKRGSGANNKALRLARAALCRRFHSSIGTRIAVSTPRRVTIWGPFLMVASKNSLNRAFASCTCQLATPTSAPKPETWVDEDFRRAHLQCTQQADNTARSRGVAAPVLPCASRIHDTKGGLSTRQLKDRNSASLAKSRTLAVTTAIPTRPALTEISASLVRRPLPTCS